MIGRVKGPRRLHRPELAALEQQIVEARHRRQELEDSIARLPALVHAPSASTEAAHGGGVGASVTQSKVARYAMQVDASVVGVFLSRVRGAKVKVAFQVKSAGKQAFLSSSGHGSSLALKDTLTPVSSLHLLTPQRRSRRVSDVSWLCISQVHLAFPPPLHPTIALAFPTDFRLISNKASLVIRLPSICLSVSLILPFQVGARTRTIVRGVVYDASPDRAPNHLPVNGEVLTLPAATARGLQPPPKPPRAAPRLRLPLR